jgi:hypothetical protein
VGPADQGPQHIGRFASENAARAYDRAAVQQLGSDTKLNFPGQTVSELPVSLGEEQKQRSSSTHYIGVTWHRANSSWKVQLYDPQTKRQRHIGCFASERDAARAYDRAAVEARGPSAKRNFTGETISDVPAKRGRLNGSEEEQDGSEEERNEEYTQQQQEVDWLEVWEEIEQIVMAVGVPILGMQEAEKVLMALRAHRLWG